MSQSEEYVPRGFVPMRDHLRALDQIERLKEQLADTRRIDGACHEAGICAMVCAALDLAPKEARVLMLLHARRSVSVPVLLHVTGVSSLGSLRTQICRVRQSLSQHSAPHGVEVHRGDYGSAQGGQYEITRELRAWLSRLIPEAFPELAP